MGRREAYALGAITAVAAAVRFATLDVQSFGGDEGVTVALLGESLGDMLHTIPDTESTPPAYYVLAWLWTNVFGTGEVGVRSLSALLGTAAVPLTGAAGAALATWRVGLVAAGLAAVNPFLVWYSQEARAYALLVPLAALSLWLFARALADPAPRRLAWWAAAAALAVATHYYAGFLVGVEGIALLWLSPARRRAAVAVGGVALAGLALLPLALDQRSTGNFERFIEGSSLSQRIREVPKKFLVGEQGTPGDYGAFAETLLVPALALAALGAVLLALSPAGPERRGGLIAAAVGVATVAVPLALAGLGVDTFAAYLLIGAWVPLSIAAAAGLAYRRAGLAAAGALAAVFLAVAIHVAASPTLQRFDYREAAEELGPARGPRAIVATPDGSFAPLRAYLGDHLELPPRGGVAVVEVDVLGMASEDESARRGGPAAAPGPAFRPVERIETDRFTIVRWRAPRPVRVSPSVLVETRLAAKAEGTIAIERERG